MEQITTNYPLKGAIESRIGGRSENQDNYGYAASPMGLVLVVCDGMGGIRGGRMASTIAVNTILRCLTSVPQEADPSEALINAIRQANAEIINTGYTNPEYQGMGTTATVLILNKKCATIAHVGDSRIYQLRGKRKVYRTFDHSMVFEMVKQGVLTEEQARNSEQSNVILKALGAHTDVEPEIAILPYIKGDRFLLCTDGFWGAMPEKDFLALLARKGTLDSALENTANKVESIGNANGGKHDNLTAAIVEVQKNSSITTKMTKKAKLLIAALVVVLVASLTLNVIYIGRYAKLTAPAATEETTQPTNNTESETFTLLEELIEDPIVEEAAGEK